MTTTYKDLAAQCRHEADYAAKFGARTNADVLIKTLRAAAAALEAASQPPGAVDVESIAACVDCNNDWYCKKHNTTATLSAPSPAQAPQEAAMRDALGTIREHCKVQPSALAKSIVATCDSALAAAPAQAPVVQGEACKRCGGMGVIKVVEITGSGGVEFENGPVVCVDDCPACNGAKVVGTPGAPCPLCKLHALATTQAAEQREPLSPEEIHHIASRWDSGVHGDRVKFIVRETELAHGIGVKGAGQ